MLESDFLVSKPFSTIFLIKWSCQMVRVKLPVGLQVLDPRAQQASFCPESSRCSLFTQHSSFPPQASQDWPEQLLLLRGP